MTNALLVLFAVAIALAASRRAWFPLAVIAALGLEYFSPGDASGLTLPKAGFAALAVTHFIMRRTSLTVPSRRILVPLGLLVSVLCVSFVWSVDPERTLVRISTLVLLVSAFFVIVTFVKEPADLRRFWDVFVLYALANAIMSFVQLGTGFRLFVDNLTTRAGGLGINPTEGGMYMTFGWLILLVYHLRQDLAPRIYRRPILRLTLMATIATGILVTGSRAGLISAVVCTLFVTLAAGDFRYTLRRLLRVAAPLAGIALMTAFLFPALIESVVVRFGASLEDGFGNRATIFTALLESVEEQPVLGTGLSTTLRITEGYSERARTFSSHNTFLGVLAETGILGLSALLIVVFVIYRTLHSLRRARAPEVRVSRLILFGLFTCVGLVMLTHELLFNKMVWACLALLESCNGLVAAQATKPHVYRASVLNPRYPRLEERRT